MAYCTLADLQSRFGVQEILQLADVDNDGAVDNAVIDSAISDAIDLIDSYLSARYKTPVDSSTLIKKLACDIARYFLYSDAPTQLVRLHYEDALAMLKKISTGLILIAEPVQVQNETVFFNSDVGVFSRKDGGVW